MEYGYNKCVAAFTATENHVTYRSGDLLVVADAAHCMMRVIGLVVQSFRLNSRGATSRLDQNKQRCKHVSTAKHLSMAAIFLSLIYAWERSTYR